MWLYGIRFNNGGPQVEGCINKKWFVATGVEFSYVENKVGSLFMMLLVRGRALHLLTRRLVKCQ